MADAHRLSHDVAPRQLGLDPAELARLASLSLRARVIVEGAIAGMHHNPHAGSSIEFAEHKEYAPGDDIRHIDWKAVARVERYYVKRFEDDNEMRTYLLLDASASMGFGRVGVSKLTYATYLCAAFCHLLGLQGDAAGLLIFDENLRRSLAPRTRPGHLRDLFTALEEAFPAGRTGVDRALGQVAEAAERKSLVLLFTDLLDAPGALVSKLRQVRSHGHDVVIFHLLDPEEMELPYEDLLHFEGVEPGDDRQLLGDPAELRAAFRRESLAFRNRWEKVCRESRIEYRFASTALPPSEVLRAFLFDRQRHRGAGARR